MKHVTKGVAPQSFEDWKALTNSDWQASYDNLQNPEKRELHQSLLIEQGWACCYCGRSIEVRDSHIEHFRPQERYEDLSLEYENLLASCIRETEPGLPLHCGHAKGADFLEDSHVSPLDPHCETRFIYTLDGQILTDKPNDVAAASMIDLLKLNIAFLRDRRAAVVRGIFDPDFLETASNDELRKIRDSARTLNEHGHASEFAQVIARFAEQLLPSITSADIA